MHPSHRQWVNEPVIFDIGDASATKDEYGLIPEADWSQVYECYAAIQILGAHADDNQREAQSTQWMLIIEPPNHTE